MKSDTNQSVPETTQGSSDSSPALPSIIVDPSLGRDSNRAPDGTASATKAPEAGPQPAAEQAAPTDAETLNIAPPPPGFIESAQDPFSLAEAERFASSFRPSWEVAIPASAADAQVASGVPISRSAPVAGPTDDELPLTLLPGQRNQRRAMALTAGAVGFFALMLVLALRSSRPEPPTAAPAAEAAAPTAAAAAPAAAEPVGAPPPVAPRATPAAEPAPAVEPAPTAAAAPEPTATPPAPETAPLPAATALMPAPEPPAPTVHLRVDTSPAVARLTLDGAPVANPFDASLPKGGKHRLEASAVGHRNLAKVVVFDRDQQLTLQLRPVIARHSAPAARPAARSSPAPARSGPPQPPVLTIEKQPTTKTKGAGFVADSPY